MHRVFNEKKEEEKEKEGTGNSENALWKTVLCINACLRYRCGADEKRGGEEKRGDKGEKGRKRGRKEGRKERRRLFASFLFFFFFFDPREPWLTVRNRRCRGKEGCYKPPYTTPGLVPEPGRCHCHGIDICSLNFLPRHGPTSVSISPPLLFSPPLFLLPKMDSSLPFILPPEKKNGRWTRRVDAPSRLTFSKFHPALTYSCLEKEDNISPARFSPCTREKKKRKETRGEKRNEDDPYLLLGCVVILRKQRSSHLNINLKRRSLRIPLCRPRPIQRRIPHRFSSTDISSLRGFAMRHVRPRTSLLYWLIYLRLVFYSVVRGARPTYNLFTHVSRLTTPRLVPLYPFCADYIARSREFDPVFLYVINCYFR